MTEISYCRKHREWWIENCSNCMGESSLSEGIERGRQMERERILLLLKDYPPDIIFALENRLRKGEAQ